VSGVIALFPAVFTSLILILTPRIGGRATAAVLANGQWGLIGFGAASWFCTLPRSRSGAPPRFLWRLQHASAGTWDCSSTAAASGLLRQPST
jgi:hypothetical protein